MINRLSENSKNKTQPPKLPDWENPEQVAAFLKQLPNRNAEVPASKSELISRLEIVFHLTNPHTFIVSMPVAGNRQTHGVIHGGANAALGETAGSIAANYCAPPGQYAVGVNIYITHHRPGTGTRIYAVATQLQAGKKLATYEIRIFNQDGKLTASGMHTIAYVADNQNKPETNPETEQK